MYNLFLLYFILDQELNLAEAVVNRLQTVGLRFCGAADQALPRLKGALPAGMIQLLIVVHFLFQQKESYSLLCKEFGLSFYSCLCR